ncbi:dipeptide/oligopeptide/nickel ABC transporter ATP-binding protein [Alkalispirochaeta sphaeroplastigenens]|uniref:Dipeptide/oligopeptide/nickel ABC transporter ATP-binding protein n=1 Tax=Alkalispirochaeta sphaeroplastigenens TaxID=1187066 RepID=A0A2S4K0U8_9SPIO|nr:ABC transporter ATP-binding protein [Alkalispirochaeta sphaeroplastigenens]POR05393.1 dipeptide/oligopeptide/nickel ABC transporter ATP-binding protein [Alkalispirochaeta sphaeroplastigenens]
MERPLLEVQDLHVHYKTDDGTARAVNGIDFSIHRGETLGLVGETGAGKTTTALALLGLVPHPPGKITGGRILFQGENLLEKSGKELRRLRGNRISIIFQDPMTSLNPLFPAGKQIAENLTLHQNLPPREALKKAGELLARVGIPASRSGNYPHEFSGGMKQRVVIAMALACNPALLIADEPTTALDVTIQAQILEILRDLKEDFGLSLLMISHDLGVVAEVADRVAVMYAGDIVETGSVEQVFEEPRHPYTIGLLNSLPDIDAPRGESLQPITGLMPDPMELPRGCSFAPRCPRVMPVCEEQKPPVFSPDQGRGVRCFLYHQTGGQP